MNTKDVAAFRELQAKTGMLISGSTALQFFDRTCYPDTDLDLYVMHTGAFEVSHWLTTIGYRYQPSLNGPSTFVWAFLDASAGQTPAAPPLYPRRGIIGVFGFFNPGCHQSVQLIVVIFSPIEVILDFHSTCMMNFIAHDRAVALYPYETFERGVSLICQVAGPHHVEARTKYVRRGWSMALHLTHAQTTDPKSDFCIGHRFVGDKKCWSIPLPSVPGYGPSTIKANSWNHGYSILLGGKPTAMRLTGPCPVGQYIVAGSNILSFIMPIMEGKMKANNQPIDDEITRLLIFFNHNFTIYH
ncbi:hypothetical protein Hypma_009684 [Hypsizygus marmoreus]|uniref:Uncharacterized protein n=1 Tax=Hypsizygus marmoreus TaxID=39966 RepID=A0A369JU71_HYPMA|nr:hypothetical protein Hypma_009684 [Hypsizygus marmoreus]